jgi:hypothetical protein
VIAGFWLATRRVAPSSAAAGYDEPDLIHRAVRDCPGDLAGSKLEVGHAAGGHAEQNPLVVRCAVGWF